MSSAPDPSVQSPESNAALAPSAPESEYITEPIVPRAPRPAAQAVRIEAPSTPYQKQRPEDEEEIEDDEDGEQPEPHEPIGEADEDDDQEDDEDEEGDEDEDDDEQAEAEDDALFNAACHALEQGHRLTWTALCEHLCTADVLDPRLGLLVTLLTDTDPAGQMLPLTGARVLSVLGDIGFGELVAEARETVGVAATSTVEARRGASVMASEPPRKKQKPMRASEVRARQSALGTVVPTPTSRRPS